MKKLLLTMTIIAVAFSVSACTFWTKVGGNGFSLDKDMDETVSFNETLLSAKAVELNIDLSVSKVTIEAINGDTLKYSQKANKKELLAGLKKDKSGDTSVLTFKNEKNPKLISGSQKSETVIQVPKGIEISIRYNGDVGDLIIDLDHLTVLAIEANTNVGNIDLSSNQDQIKFSTIKTTTDVGNINIALNGKMPNLEQIIASTATGEIDISTNGTIEKAIDVQAKSDVGDIRLDFDGDYNNAATIKLSSSIGDMDLLLPRKHKIVLDAQMTEFTSSLKIDDMPFAKSKTIYNIDGDKSTFEIDLSVTVGEATIKYSN